MKIDKLKAYMIFKWLLGKICLDCSQKLPLEKKIGPLGSLSEILGRPKNRENTQKLSIFMFFGLS